MEILRMKIHSLFYTYLARRNPTKMRNLVFNVNKISKNLTNSTEKGKCM